ncbi:MAG TPA: hypothetical protein VGL81_07375 [Polyangiaceae bacterium]|jgi:hypothetical protein
MRTGFVVTLIGGVVIGGCGGTGLDGLFGGSGGAPIGSSGGKDAGASSSSSSSSSGGNTSSGSGNGSGSSSGAGSSGSSGGVADDASSPAPADGGVTALDAGSPCYSEPYDPSADISDLAAAYKGNNWLTTSLAVMQRRYPTGYFVLNAEQTDPQLPQFVDTSSWSALMSSMMTVLDAETTGWDFDNATVSVHPFVIVDTMQISAPILTTWPQGEILQYITDTSTQIYDQTELEGEEGTYDAIFLFDDLDSACNGLAAATAVGDQIPSGISARDGLAAHLYYLELYLRDGRTAHAAEYATMKADPTWQKLVRYEWARGHFWDGQAAPNANLQIAAAPIWTNIDAPASLAEIQQFTGEDPAAVACHP